MSENLLNNIENEIGFCDTCKELTPQTHETAGARCHICYNQNSYTMERAFTKADDKWLFEFWRNKYYQIKNPINSTFTFTITPAN